MLTDPKKSSDQIDKGELKYEIRKNEELVMMVNEERKDDTKKRHLCLCCDKQQESDSGENENEVENVKEEEIEEIEEIEEELNETNIEDEIIEIESEEEQDEESEEESFYVDTNNENNRMRIDTQQEMINRGFAETIEELNQRYERNYQQRKAQQINEYIRKKKTEDMKVIDEFEKKSAKDIKRENEEWKQEAKREMQRLEEANLDDIYDIEEQKTYMRDVMAQRQTETDELLKENERRANEARWQTRRRIIRLERTMITSEIEGTPDYREDNEEFEMELMSEIDARMDRMVYSNDSSYYNRRGDYIRKVPWDERVHYARRAEKDEEYDDEDYEEEDDMNND